MLCDDEEGQDEEWDGGSRQGLRGDIFVYLRLNSCSYTAATNTTVKLLYSN